MTTVMGVDLSLTGTGVSILSTGPDMAPRYDTYLIKTTGKKGDTLEQRSARLDAITQQVAAKTGGRSIDLVVIESPSYGSQHGAQHDRSGLWWLTVQMFRHAGHSVATVSPNGRAKYATGKGNADKDTVMAAAIRGYPEADITNNNVADAVILSAMGSQWLDDSFDPDLTIKQLEALEAAAWPI